ncbi:MAG: hypothetical protein BWY43_00771 [candidate division WS2 bacterium ADurb.Bin280]|uniref:Uncharacterized protein n=1 Tax=candidate division WS2 bacterium ADurb.Bin280 TaxID=1852829 RepID=A0A1V5SC93_9BACT|nr:MAG: hypothetical protein BWY43_00771 [candidate division WS2 bacterium ADurb.Bin280]
MEDVKERIDLLGSRIAVVPWELVCIFGAIPLLVTALMWAYDPKMLVIVLTVIVSTVTASYLISRCLARNNLLALLIAEAMKDVAKIAQVSSERGGSPIYRLRFNDDRQVIATGHNFDRAMAVLRQNHLTPSVCDMRVRSFRQTVDQSEWMYDVAFIAARADLKAIAERCVSEKALQRALILQFKRQVADHNPRNMIGMLELQPKAPEDIELSFGFSAKVVDITRIEGESPDE